MGESAPTAAVPSGSGPRFRIIPGRILGDNGRRNVPRSTAFTSSNSRFQLSTPSFDLQMNGQDTLRPVQYDGHAEQAAQMTTHNANTAEEARMVSKCARFFQTLLHLSQQPDQQQQQQGQGQQTAKVQVTELVKLLICGSIPPEVFTCRLQEALHSQAQPHLLPFLHRTLPALRTALQKGEVVIEGICAAMPPPLPADMFPASTHWDWNALRTNNENTYMPQHEGKVDLWKRPGATAQPTIGGYAKPEGSDKYSTEESSSEAELRTLSSTQTQYKLLNGYVIVQKIQRTMPGGDIPEDEVIAMISQATELRVRIMLAKLAAVTEHRLKPLRNHPYYRAIDDTRRQLHFVEELEKLKYERRENHEKEALIRLSKTKGNDKEALVGKAKRSQRAGQEAARNRDANATAIAALGDGKGNRKPWLETSNNPFDQAITAGVSLQIHRPRTKRVTMRDLQLMIVQDPISRTSPLRHRLALFSCTTDNVIAG